MNNNYNPFGTILNYDGSSINLLDEILFLFMKKPTVIFFNSHFFNSHFVLKKKENVYNDADSSDHSDYDMYSDASDSYSAHSKRDDK